MAAVAAREATYWLRDPRYSLNLVAALIMPVVLIVAGQAGGGEAMPVVLTLGPLVAWMHGFSLSNDLAADDTAFALHLVSGVPGRADRWGRVLPVLAFATPLVAGFAVLSAWLVGRWNWLPPVLGLTLSLLFASCGVSSATSARWVYPAVKPGESPLRQPQGAAMATMAAQGVSLGLSAAAGAVPTGLAVAAMLTHGTVARVLGIATLLVGIAVGLAVLWGGVRWGGRVLDQRGPEIMQQIKAFP